MEEKKCCCCEPAEGMSGKTKVRSEEEFKKLMNRLKKIEGQVRGVEGMLERNAYCPDILIQVSAITSALNSFNKELLASHINSCVVRDLREGDDDTAKEAVDELVRVMHKLMK